MLEVGLLLVVLIVVVFVGDRIRRKVSTVKADEVEEIVAPPDDCCGAHSVCEKTIDDITSDPKLYFDDEELDAFVGYATNEFTDNEIEQFREVLYTLKPKEIVQWLYSLELRKVEMPGIIKEEARMLVTD